MKKNRKTKLSSCKGDVTAVHKATGYSFSMVNKVNNGDRKNKMIAAALKDLAESRKGLKKYNRKNQIKKAA